MGSHYHVVPHTRQANLSLLMRHINGVYTQRFNPSARQGGALVPGLFKAILVHRDAYLLEACRCAELNPGTSADGGGAGRVAAVKLTGPCG
jgi:hypothetical protein